ncbi:MAG TPA: hypothetical protein VIL64_01780 [Solirubrobacteraceae bacterium]|jgi:2-hydroxychromene-2-carboxylate isomerase
MGDLISLDARRRERRSDADHGLAPQRQHKATFYFDLADPGTYLAAERVDRLFPGVTWRPTSLEALQAGAAPPDPADAQRHFTERAEMLAMPLVWPDGDLKPVRAAMRTAAFAAEQGRGAEFVLAASRLAFCGGFDLNDPGVLAEAAAAASIGLRECLHAAGDLSRDGAIEEGGRRLLAHGCDRLPAVRVGRVLFSGEGRIAEASAMRRDPVVPAAASGREPLHRLVTRPRPTVA